MYARGTKGRLRGTAGRVEIAELVLEYYIVLVLVRNVVSWMDRWGRLVVTVIGTTTVGEGTYW